MNILNHNLKLIIFTICFVASLFGQSQIESHIDPTEYLFFSSHQLDTPFKMSHGFSMIASSQSGIHSTKGIYSNHLSYNFSNNLKLKSNIYLLSGQSNLPYQQNVDFMFDIGLDYQLNQHTHIGLHISKFYPYIPLQFSNQP